MSLEIKRGVARDVTRELTQAFQLSNFCRELAKSKIIPATRRRLGERPPETVEERPGDYNAGDPTQRGPE